MLQQPPRKCGSNVPRPRKYLDTLHNKEWLYTKYEVEKLSAFAISMLLGCEKSTVMWSLRKFGFGIRTGNESQKLTWDRRGRKEVTQAEMIIAYGGRCACCGENEFAFLTLDHIGGGGAEHRASIKQGNKVLRIRQQLKAEGWPKDKYRILCMNCNHATRYGKTCPHQLSK